MKQILSILIMSVILSSCGNNDQSKAIEQAKQVQNVVKQNTPGLIPTSEAGYFMKAKINGKDWVATAMMPNDNSNQRNVYGEKDGERITFDVWMKGAEAGKKSEFKEGNSAAYLPNNDEGMWDGLKGEMEITKVADNWVEGKFFFTATKEGSGNIEVTDGFFHIPQWKNK